MIHGDRIVGSGKASGGVRALVGAAQSAIVIRMPVGIGLPLAQLAAS